MKDRVLVINPGLEERTTRTGRRRFAVRIDAEPILINNDPKSLGQPVADAIANHFRQRIRTLAEKASPATIRARAAAAKAFAEGKAWAVKRYGGGRIGSIPPNQSDRVFNDSGRMADSIVANASSDGSWRINMAANRLDPDTASGGTAGVFRIWKRLLQLIPEFGDPAQLMENTILKRTLENVVKERLHAKGPRTSRAATAFQAFSAMFLKTGT